MPDSVLQCDIFYFTFSHSFIIIIHAPFMTSYFYDLMGYVLLNINVTLQDYLSEPQRSTKGEEKHKFCKQGEWNEYKRLKQTRMGCWHTVNYIKDNVRIASGSWSSCQGLFCDASCNYTLLHLLQKNNSNK